MRRSTFAVVAVAIVPLLAACASSEAPGWTYAPAPSVTPAASAEASGSPAASSPASAAPTGTAEASEAPASAEPSGSGEPRQALTVTAPVGAAASGFDPTELEAPADRRFRVTFDNQDTGVPHNWVLKNPDGTNVDIGDTTFFNGPDERTYTVPALAAGTYSYLCEIHPTTMTGTLTAG
jgi:plastocyanin